MHTGSRPEAPLQLQKRGHEVPKGGDEEHRSQRADSTCAQELKLRGHGDKLDVTDGERKRSMVICIIKFWYLGFALLLPVLTYLANQNNSTDKQV